jgi:succinate dehydrogenase / fumarate reductase iron-sulfur subunit
MAYYHEEYAGPAALNRAFTLLADSRDGLFEERLGRALESCYQCRTEFNCTEVCPKNISSTGAIKYIQRLALKHPSPPVPASGPELLPATPVPIERRALLVNLLGIGSVAALGVVGAGVVIGPALSKPVKRWVPVAPVDEIRPNDVTTVLMKYDLKSGMYTQQVSVPVLVSRTGNEIVCFNASCSHLGCIVKWDGQSGRFRCACHGGNFDRDGSVLAGPPPRPLDRYVFKVESGHLFVEVG